MDEERKDAIEELERKLIEMTEKLPSEIDPEETSKESAIKKKQAAVNDLVKVANALATLKKVENEEQQIASTHELKLEEMNFNAEKLKADIEGREQKLKFDYFETQQRMDEAIRRNEEDAKKRRSENIKTWIGVGTTVLVEAFRFKQLSALSDVVNDGRIHTKLLPFLWKSK